jgi:hypothetical protein
LKMKNVTYSLILASAMLLSNGFALADESPTLDQVYQAARAGHMEDAERMMDKVLKEHPNSAKAHFVEAELLAKRGQMARAGDELQNAERLKPDLSFANPQAVQDLRNRIAPAHRINQSPAGNYQAEPSNSFPWGMLLLGVAAIAIIVLIMRKMNSRNSATFPNNYQPSMQSGSPAPQPYGGGMPPAGPYGGGMGGGMMGGGMGGGIMGGLATGAAVGVGMVAGEALAHHFMDGGRSEAAPVADSWGNSSNNMGGSDFGIADNSSWSDSSNVADNGGGGDWG